MVKSKTISNIARVAIILTLLWFGQCISFSSTAKAEQPKTIVQTNRFYSSTQKQANYNISGLVIGKPLILILKPTSKISQILQQNLTITFSGEQQQIVCPFKQLTDLCVVPKIPELLKMMIKCTSLPCQVEWVIYQPEPKTANSKQYALNLYNLQNTNYHMMGEITCNNPQITTLNEDVTVYSDTKYIRAYHNNAIYLFFTTFSRGYIYVDVGETARNCAFIDFYNVPSTIKTTDKEIKDFITKQSGIHYEISDPPKQDFRIECSATRLDKFERTKSVIVAQLSGEKDGKKVHILSQTIKSIVHSSSNDFTLVVKALAVQYDKLYLSFKVDNSQLYLFNFQIQPSEPALVELGESIFFNLKKDEQITLKVIADEGANAQDKYYLIEKRKEELKLSDTVCPAKVGCEIKVSAIADTDNMIYISSKNDQATRIDEDGKGLFEFEQIQFLEINKKIKHKIRLGDNIFLRKKIEKSKTYQVHVNSPNVIIYSATKSICPVPDQHCRERTSNYHHPFIYQAKQSDELLFNVEGLDNTQFELTIIEDNQLIQLTDGIAFSYTMDAQQERIDFTFKLKQKSDVSFNLISPLNAVKLYVSNQKSGNNDLQLFEQSSDGFIMIEKDEVKELDFTISVVKAKRSQEKYFTHFTIVAASDKTNLRLQPTVANYQTLAKQKSKNYIFEFDKSDDYILSFSVYNLKDNPHISILLEFSKDGVWDKAASTKLSKEADFLDLTEVALTLCQEEGENQCEVMIRITNQMQIEIDFTVMLLTKNSIIQLKDGIWQTFPENKMVTTSSFYFYPRHNTNNILILYQSPLPNIHVSYKLWRYDEENIKPDEWPFPFIVDPAEKMQNSFKLNNYISIDHQQMMKTCWPSCVVLINFYLQFKDGGSPLDYTSSYFKIMASNSQIELPEKHKISLSLGKLEDKEVLIDLKYPLERQELKFYSTTTIGDCSLSANVYSQKESVCPIMGEKSDLAIIWGEYSLQMSKVKDLLKQKDMESDKNLYLCVTVHSESNCKITLQYSTEQDGYKNIHVDSFEDIKLNANETKYFQLDGMVEQYSKITRINGFPFAEVRICKIKEELQKCKQQFKNFTEKGKQIVVKTESLDVQWCPTCTTLIKFTTVEPAALNFHSQSKFAEIELKEGVTFSDFLNEQETNKYLLHANPTEDIVINIHVQEGNIEVKLTDIAQVNLAKSSSKDTRVIQFIVKGNKPAENQSQSKSLLNPLALTNTFKMYHLTIVSLNESQASTYTIAYSSGSRQFFLQDGLIVDYLLESNKLNTFYYCNERQKDHVYFTLSTQNANSLDKLKIKTYSIEDINNKKQREAFPFNKPKMAKKTPSPTLLLSFPPHNCFEIEVTNPTATSTKVSMGINHQQVIFLPFNHDFPLQLHPLEYLNILVDVNIPGFIDLKVRKCDQSVPSFKYTFNYDGFIKGEYMYETVLNQEPFFQFSIKAERIGTLYINVQAAQEEASLLSLKATFSQTKTKTERFVLGGHGAVTYEIVDQNRAKVAFPTISCKNCKNVKYYTMTSQSQTELFRQLICPNSFFSTSSVSSGAPIPRQKIDPQEKDKTLSFVYTMEKDVNYLGIVAVSDSGEEYYYPPIEIASLMALWSRTSYTQKALMGFLLLIVLCILIICVRRYSRQGYKPLNEFPQ